MSAAQTQAATPPPVQETGRLELRVEPGSETLLRLVIVPPTTLNLSLASVKEVGRTYKLHLTGTQTNLVPGTVCRVIVNARTFGIDRTYEVGNLSLDIQGEKVSVNADVDVFMAGLFGEGKATVSVVPDFPFAPSSAVKGTLDFKNPLDVEGFEPKGGVLLGTQLTFEPVFSRKFKQSTLKLAVYPAGTLKAGTASRTLPHAAFTWTADADDAKNWRVGCAQRDGHLLLTWLATQEDQRGFDLRLEVIQGEEPPYVVWEKRNHLTFPKPELVDFRLEHGAAFAQVKNLARGFALPLELSLWSYETQAPGTSEQSPVMDPLTRPIEGKASSSQFFLDLIHPDVLWGDKKVFALLRIPKTLTGTDVHVPVSAVLDYKEADFQVFDDDELWLEPPKPGKGKVSKSQKTPKAFATALASKELTLRPSRMPRFGAMTAGVQDGNLRLSFKLVGDSGYWKAAAPAFSILDETGQTELVKLDVKPSQTNPRVQEVSLPLTDKRLFGKKVQLRGVVTKPDARLWGEVVAAPPAALTPYTCVPSLSDLDMGVVKLMDDTSYIQLRCRASHIPNGKNGTTLAFRVFELMEGVAEPIALTKVRIEYDSVKGAGGLSDGRGWLVARIRNPDAVQRLQGQGRFKLEARVLDNKGKVLNTDVAPVSAEFGGAPRKVAGTLIWGRKVSPEFRAKVFAICDELEMDPQHLMACMAFETGRTFSPSIQNRGGNNAYGLIQFTPVNEKPLGTTLAELVKMTAVQQLDYVQKYFRLWIGVGEKKRLLKTLGDVYACILCPDAIGKPDTHVCYRKGTNAYTKNKDLDRPAASNPKAPKGYITKADITVPVEEQYALGKQERE